MQLNLRRGLFRHWIVFGTLFAIVVSIAASGGILASFEKSSPSVVGQKFVNIACGAFLPAQNRASLID